MTQTVGAVCDRPGLLVQSPRNESPAGPGNPQLAHAMLQRAPLHSQASGGAVSLTFAAKADFSSPEQGKFNSFSATIEATLW